MNIHTGILEVQVYSNTIVQPVEGVTIEIRDNNQTLHTLITNFLGQTPAVSLPAPDIINSLENTGKEPYETYQIIASKPGYTKIIVDNVEVYPDTSALQSINLTPTTTPSLSVITIEPPTLYGDYEAKIPEAEIKPLPESGGFVVLEEVVIPEFIVVHDGKPNEAATNYTVPYIDYIKNVACCEIYSIWPTETIKANVYAIISFTLNRVYTEWYRNKGYDFTITSSTAYDQLYTPGRTIFQQISDVVDEIFNGYVTKPDIRQPLLTQYCDGRKVSCPTWMRQWESKDLGLQGKSALEILKFFYGSNVYIDTADKISGIPSSFGGVNLTIGSSGNSVRIVQEQINAISGHYPLIPKVRVDGTFGEQTAKSIEVFQEVFGLPVTGVVDERTWYKLSQIYVAVAKLVY